MEKYPHIFTPGKIGNLTVKNRVKYAATETNFNTCDGYVTDREVAYMEAQARGGAAIVTTQGAYPDIKGEGKGFRGTMSISDDKFIPGLAKIADVIKRNGAHSCLQILHCGREGGVDVGYSLMPSVVPQKLSYFKPPREITRAEIKQSVLDHVEASRRAVKAGFDMIELSGIVGYLISTFISRYTNKRTDEYGGSLQNRCKLMVEILHGIKDALGDQVPVGIRLCGLELLDDRGGNSIGESMETFHIAQEAGADYVSVTVGWHESSQSVITRDVPMGHWLWVAKEVKKYVDVPVMMAFRQFIPEIPENAIKENTIDFWEACRPMIADPELPRKAAEGREEEIIPCIACNLCFSRLYYHQPIMCTVRPTVGYERDPRWGYYGFNRTKEEKKITVVGAGPAGLQFAAVAASKGNRVSVFEQKACSGGSLRLASLVDDGAIELLRPVSMLEHECLKQGVEIGFETPFSVEMAKSNPPDILVVASGASIKEFHVPDTVKFFTPEHIIAHNVTPPLNSVIIGGDGVGLGLAVHLLGKGDFNITIIEESGRLGRDVNPFYLWQYTRLLKEKKVRFLLNSRVTGTREKEVIVHTPDGERTINTDGIISAIRERTNFPVSDFEPLAGKIILIGDAKKPRRLNNAIHDGYKIAMEVLQ